MKKGQKHTSKTKRKMSISHKQTIYTKEEREKINRKLSEVHKGKKLSDKIKQKISFAHKGKKLSEETKKKLRQINLDRYKGRKVSQKTKEKIRLVNLGKKLSEETKEKIRNTLLKKNKYKFKKNENKFGKDYRRYCEKINRLTKYHRLKILNDWNGFCFYSGKYIKNNLNKNNRYQPVLDHKISKLDGYINKISPNLIASITNIVVCSREENSRKNGKSFFDGVLSIQKSILGFYKSHINSEEF